MPISTLAKAKSGEQPCPAYNAAGHRHGKERVDGFVDESQQYESRGSGLPPRDRSPPANAGAGPCRGPHRDD